METKPWYASKTMWANILMAIGVFVNAAFKFEVSAEVQGAIIVLVNFILRAVTKNKITLS